MRGHKKIRFPRIRAWINAFLQTIRKLRWKFTGALLEEKLADTESDERSEAQKAVDRVVWETDIAPDCVSASVVRGGPCILLKTDGEWEATIHNTYAEAADEAIKFINLQGEYMEPQAETSKLNRRARREFDAQRRKRRGGRKAGQVRH